MSKLLLLFITLHLINTDLKAGGVAPAVLFVKSDATGANNGTTWTNAFTNLNQAIASVNYGDAVTIYMAKGTYMPEDSLGAVPNDPRNKFYFLYPNMSVYGGFAGNENVIGFDMDSRDLFNNETILSGDIGVMDDKSDNVYHIMYAQNVGSSTILNGLTFEKGNASGSFGGAIYCFAFTVNGSSPAINHCIFRNNVAEAGGAIFFTAPNSIISGSILNSSFIENYANNSINGGGAVYVSGDNGDVPLFFGNCVFFDNGDSHIGYDDASTGSLLFYNCSFSRATQRALNITFWDSGMQPIGFVNCIFWDNNGDIVGTTNPGGVTDDNSQITIDYSIVEESSFLSVPTNIMEDPLFFNVSNDYLLIEPGSPAINQGYDLIATSDSDILGHPKLETRDMGAYEFQGKIFVKKDAIGRNNGYTWEDAFNELRLPMGRDGNTDLEIWVAKGTYYPTDDSNRDSSFVLYDSVKVYGGFEGTEPINYDLSLRNFYENEAIMSGDIGVPNSKTDNSYTVVKGTNLSAETILDGFTISDGNNDPSSFEIGYGGGFNLLTQYSSQSNPTFRNLIFYNNFSQHGGGFYSYCQTGGSADLTFKNCEFVFNEAGYIGGLDFISAVDAQTNVTIRDSKFIGNKAFTYAAIGFFGENGEGNEGIVGLTIENTMFEENESTAGGGAVNLGTGYSSFYKTQITNSVFNRNIPGHLHKGYNGTSNANDPKLTNCTFYGGQFVIDISGWAINEAIPWFKNSILWGNDKIIEHGLYTNGGILVTNSIISDDYYTTGSLLINNSINDDPKFVDSTINVFNLRCNSPAINLGNAAGAPSEDITGFSRTGNPDAGAYEFGHAEVRSYIADGSNPILTNTPFILANSVIENTNESYFIAGYSSGGQSGGFVLLQPGFEVAPKPGQASVFTADIGGGCVSE